MSGLTKKWQSWLFHEHGIVGLPLLRGKPTTLLSVYVTTKSVVRRNLTLREVGPLPDCGDLDENKANEIREGLQQLKEDEYWIQDGIYEVAFCSDEFSCTVANSSSIFAKFADMLLSCTGKNSNSLYCYVRDVECHKVKDTKLFYQWKPHLDKIMLAKPSIEEDGVVTLWVVTEVYYADVIVFSRSKTAALEVAADLAAAAGAPPGVGSVKCGFSITSDGSVVVHGPKIPFGFRAIRLSYNPEGVMVRRLLDLGSNSPGFRSENDEFDASKHPLFHMEGLFSKEHLPAAESAEELECLEFEEGIPDDI